MKDEPEDTFMTIENFAPKFEMRAPYDPVLKSLQYLPGRLGKMGVELVARRTRHQVEGDLRAALAATPKGALCLDLGANIGSYTRWFAEAGMRTLAFEPDPHTFDLLSKNLSGFDNVELHQKAAGHAPGTLQLQRLVFWDGKQDHWTEGSSVVFRDELMDPANCVDVEMIDFVDFLDTLDRDIAILKMDIEGAEWEMFPKLIASGWLDRIDYLFMETHEYRNPERRHIVDGWRALAAERAKPVMNFNWM